MVEEDEPDEDKETEEETGNRKRRRRSRPPRRALRVNRGQEKKTDRPHRTNPCGCICARSGLVGASVTPKAEFTQTHRGRRGNHDCRACESPLTFQAIIILARGAQRGRHAACARSSILENHLSGPRPRLRRKSRAPKRSRLTARSPRKRKKARAEKGPRVRRCDQCRREASMRRTTKTTTENNLSLAAMEAELRPQ